MKKNQSRQLVILLVLLVLWVLSAYYNHLKATPEVVVAAQAAKAAHAAQAENMLTTRFHRIRAEMDGLYHYRLKPMPFNPEGNPFRLPLSMTTEDASPTADAPAPADPAPVRTPTIDAAPVASVPAESGSLLLRHAVEASRIGGVVTLGDTSELNINGELHKEGELFTSRVNTRLVLLRIKKLTTTFAILALGDPAAGNAEMRVKLN
jgi:hypothetical protein